MPKKSNKRSAAKHVPSKIAPDVGRSTYPRDLVAPLRDAWKGWLPRDGEILPLPTDEQLGRILEIAFHASFTTEERRSSQFSLIACPPDESWHALRFTECRPLTVHEVRRLAPAGHVRDAMIGIDFDTDSGEPTIWGFSGQTQGRLVITAPSPGHLSLSRNDRPMPSLELGRIYYEKTAVPIDSFFQNASDKLWEGVVWAGGAESRLRPVLIVDEAHHLRTELLEDLRLLTNYAMDSENRLTVVLVGHPELRRRMGMAALDALAQRIVVRAHVRGLARDEMGAYLAHRLRLAGTEVPLFEPPTVEAIFQASSGLPRKANALAHHALFAAAITKAKSVTTEHVQSAMQEVA